jgi:hypothetical protein
MRLMGDVNTGWIRTDGRLFSAALIGESMSYGDGVLLYFLLKMAANVASAVIVSSPTALKGTPGCGCLTAYVVSLDVIRSPSVEESCGICKL